MRILHAALASVPLAASIACGSSLNSPGGGTAGTGGTVNTGQAGTVGTGGTVGVAGTIGTGGTVGVAGTVGNGGTVGVAGTVGTGGWATGGTTGSGGAPALPPPTCLVDLIASCPLTTACHYALSDAGTIDKWCYETGETLSVTRNGNCNSPSGQITTVNEVRRADGSLCYSFESSCFCGQACEISEKTWRNGAGAVIARAHDSGFHISVTCEITGETCSGAADPPSGRLSCLPSSSGPSCTQGTCP